MLLKKLVLKSKNYVYVYHSGDLEDITFMGMSEDAYLNHKSSYNVTAFIRVNNSMEESLADVTEQFTREAKDRDISGKDSISAIQCVAEFYSELRWQVQDGIKKSAVLYQLVLNIDNPTKAILVEGAELSNLIKGIDLKSSNCTVVTLDNVLDKLTVKRKTEITLGQELKSWCIKPKYINLQIAEDCNIHSVYQSQDEEQNSIIDIQPISNKYISRGTQWDVNEIDKCLEQSSEGYYELPNSLYSLI